jgi:hypothetical protein
LQDTEAARTRHDDYAVQVHSDAVPFPAASAELVRNDVVVDQFYIFLLENVHHIESTNHGAARESFLQLGENW